MDSSLQRLIDAPLANALRLNLPMGRKSAPRAQKAEADDGFAPEKLTGSELIKRKEDAKSAKLVSVLDYYATTSVPFDRIAEHTKLTVEQVTESMAKRGRTE